MLNPITYTEKIVGDFLRYQLTTYPFADDRLNDQMRDLLSLEVTRDTPLLRGPYISLSQAFERGAALADLGAEGVLHPLLGQLAGHSHAYLHQEQAFRAIHGGRHTLVSTGTGSGKTECFLYPIISRCLALRDEGAAPGITAVIVYPMNALAEDQLGRLRRLLCGTGVSFGLYTGRTPRKPEQVSGVRLSPGASRADYDATLAQLRAAGESRAVHPPEERASRPEMRSPGMQPRILLTNVKQLELLLTRRQDLELFDGARLEFMVFDEAHTFTGAQGAETACLIRRLRTYCGKRPDETVCVATSATIADPESGVEAGRVFASRFFGVRAEHVELVGESYAPDQWASPEARVTDAPPSEDPTALLSRVLAAIDAATAPARADLAPLRAVIEGWLGESSHGITPDDWPATLHAMLTQRETAWALAQDLDKPQPLAELLDLLAVRLGRRPHEAEVLAWLALGAASRAEGRPLMRPVVHGFVRGVEGAVVTFPDPREAAPELHLSGADAQRAAAEAGARLYNWPVTTCTTCGQHYFEHHLEDFGFTEDDRVPQGGDVVRGTQARFWRPLSPQSGGDRLVLLDRTLASADDEDDDDTQPRRTAEVFACRCCGAMHSQPVEACGACGTGRLVRLLVVQQKADDRLKAGKLTRCVSCGALGRMVNGRYREPARPVRALTVSDVHVLGQSMIQHQQPSPGGGRRLLIFADNRQDAAFQAGWMRDHARRYRLRALIDERLREGPVSVGDLVMWLVDRFDRDEALSRTLMPEVWRWLPADAAQKHATERQVFLRLTVLREVATGTRQRIGLEPWGRLRVEYHGLDVAHPFFTGWGARLQIAPEALREGVSALLDGIRRQRVLYDEATRYFSKYWRDGDDIIQRGYVPAPPGGPQGLKLHRGAHDHAQRVKQWISDRGDTTARQVARKWGVPRDDIPAFLEELWQLVTDDVPLLIPAVLRGGGRRGEPLAGSAGVRQLDVARLRLTPHEGVWRCNQCRRTIPRATPHDRCMAWRCDGTLSFEPPSESNYDLLLLGQQFAMVRPEEHSAQVPGERRSKIEARFKNPRSRVVNTLVCTPTLEMGVDIGALDAVLMRNVPPLPANYWQRAGRAGRRHRMAVNLTYARPASHDRSYFAEPLKMLDGEVRPPSFNLRNGVMVRKHVHAMILTTLHARARDVSVAQSERDAIQAVIDRCFPRQVRPYFFDEAGYIRGEHFDVRPFADLITRHAVLLIEHVRGTFARGWPLADEDVVKPKALQTYVEEAADELDRVIRRLRKRLDWALTQLERLEDVRKKKGTLDPAEDALRRRCDRLVKRLKGIKRRKDREAEGYDDTYTMGVLAAEGFLPGYGLDSGAVAGFHQAPRFDRDLNDYQLRRATALAVREYSPGNLIYANGHRFIPRFFQLDAEEPKRFVVDVEAQAVRELEATTTGAASMSAQAIHAFPVCDVDLPHQSHISDDEDYRFQMGVAVYGQERDRHDGGDAWLWGQRTLTRRDGVHLRLVNVGASKLVEDGALGYPVCGVCGDSRSPYSSQAARDAFAQDHMARCGKPVERMGIYANVVADALTLTGCADRDEAYSVMEAIRQGAANVLEMEVGDLQLLVVGQPGEAKVDAVLYDPMPGGSGLLHQILGRWREVWEGARRLVEECPATCARACIDCMLLFRNSWYHRHLDRERAAKVLYELGPEVRESHPIEARLPSPEKTVAPVNQAEDRLIAMLKAAGFSGFQTDKEIDLGPGVGRTLPDVWFDDPDGYDEGTAVYLDGLSEAIHGNADVSPPRTPADRRDAETGARRRVEAPGPVGSGH